MSFVRALLLALTLPALLLPEGARFCLHELLCHGAASACGCPEARAPVAMKSCCSRCEKAPPPAGAARVAPSDASCCVKVPPSQRVAPTAIVERAALDHALALESVPHIVATPFDAASLCDPPLARAASPPPPIARLRFHDATVTPPLRL